MSQKKVDTQPSALLMLSSEEMSFSLLGGLNDSNVPSLLAIPQEPPNSSTDSASHLFLTDADVDNFVGQTSASSGPVSTSSQQKSLSTTISSFLPNPFSTPLLGASHQRNTPPPSNNQSYTSSISQPPSSAYQNTLANNPPHFGGDDAGNSYQYRRTGKYQHVPAPNYYSPPSQPPHFGTSLPHQAAPTQPLPYAPPSYGQPPPQEQTVLYGLNDRHQSFPPNSAFYRPIEAHWFYTKKIGDKTTWMPFSYADSGRLEEMFSGGDQNNQLVGVEGGRYDVDIPGRLKKSVYWEEENSQVRRCSWFYRPEGDSHFVPYDEKIAAGLEESYKYAVQNSDFHKRLAFPTGETIIIHSPTAIVHYPPSSQPDAWGNVMGDSRPQVVRRGVTEFENIPKDESDKVDHLVLIVLGFDYKAKKIVECVDEFRQTAEQMTKGHFSRSIKDGQVGRVEFLPVIWSHDHLLDDVAGVDKVLEAVMLTSIGKLRHFANEMLVELMFYASPSHAQKAVTSLTEALNNVYSTFKARHTEFTKGVSVVGHGVGSVILYDILANQGEDSPDLCNTDQSTPPERAKLTSGQNFESVNQAGLKCKNSLNDSSSSLASLAESDRMSTLGINSTLEEVLEKLGMKEYEERFKSEQIDVSSLVLLNESDIKEIGLPLGPRKKLQEFIKKNQPQNATDVDVSKTQQKQLAPLPTMQQQQNNLVEDGSSNHEDSSKATFTFSVKSHQDSIRGTDVLVLKYRPLKFELANFFALGSPVAMVLALRGVKLLGEDFHLPTCLGYYNIFHPFDPLAYRMEPLVLPSVPQKAVLIPHHKGRKRFHLELKENLARIGFDIKQRIMESFRSTWRTINNFAYGHKSNPPEPKINDDDVDREVNSVLAEMQKEADDAGSVVASSVADDSDFPVGSLNQGRRVDYVLQEKPIEIFNDYIFALASSSCYWQSEDTALMLLKEIYLSMGIVSQKPGMPPQPGLPLGPPPKSGFIQSSALSKGNNPVAHASPYPSYPSQHPQMQSYQQTQWSSPNTGAFPIGPPPTNPISSFASHAPPPTINQMPPSSQKLPPPTTSQIISSLSSDQMLPPPPTNQMFNSVSYGQAMPPPPTNQKLPPPPTNQMFSSVSYNQAMPPPPTNQMFSTLPSSKPPPPMMNHPSFHPGGYAHHPPPPAYREGVHQNYPAGPGAVQPTYMGLGNTPLGPPPTQKDFAKLD